MDRIDIAGRHRTLRWYEWVVLLLLMILMGGVRAESVYKCTNAQGDVAYQSQICAPGHHSEEMVMAPTPAPTPSPAYAVGDKPMQHPAPARKRREPASRQTTASETSYECRVSNGDVFYRHGHCPHSVSASGGAQGGKGRVRGAGGSGALTVSSRPVPREEACRQMHRAGAAGRSGHEHDETGSTYERNLGNDPCK
jgi:hypothetical protein